MRRYIILKAGSRIAAEKILDELDVFGLDGFVQRCLPILSS
jgi:hypothetical protein